VTVVADDSEQTVLWLPQGVGYVVGDDLFGDWRFEQRTLSKGELRVSRPDQPFAVLLFRRDDDSFRGWYVNLERPQRRTALGFDYEDELLDIWCEVGGEPELLDEDELEEAVRREIFSPERAEAIRANAEWVLRNPPWPTGWEDWQPDPRWQAPYLPPAWDRL
jgi:hypothetical protein